MAEKRAELEGDPQGLAASAMSDSQYQGLLDLIAEYANTMPPEIASRRMKSARDAPRDRLFFGWAGDIERPAAKPIEIGSKTTENRHLAGNYYRIQSPTFLIEFANTQNQSNHSHAVWREFEGDFTMCSRSTSGAWATIRRTRLPTDRSGNTSGAWATIRRTRLPTDRSGNVRNQDGSGRSARPAHRPGVGEGRSDCSSGSR